MSPKQKKFAVKLPALNANSISFLPSISQKTNSPYKNYGKLPKYIDNFHKEAAQEIQDELAYQERLKIPPNHYLVSNSERNETLRNLRDAQKEI